MKISTIPALNSFWSTPSRYKILYGGRASGKSYAAALHVMMSSRAVKLNILCLRQLQNSIRQSVYTLLKDLIFTYGYQDEFTFTISEIRHNHTGSIFKFMGISRNVDEIKSTENIDICYIEEAHALNQEQFDIINPTIRKEHSEIIILFNPQHRQDYVFQRFVENPPEDSIIRKINYDENPYLSETMSKVIEAEKLRDYEEFEHIYLGEPREGDDRALFAYSDIERAMDGDYTEIDRTGVYSIACDVARFGKDSSVISVREGHIIHQLQDFKGFDTMEFSTQIERVATEHQAPDAVFIDSIGVGAGVVDKVRQMGVRHVVDANVAMKATEVDKFQNKRAEMYFKLREFVVSGGKLPNDKELKEELLALKYFYNETSGKVQLIKKDDLKEELGRSPDKSDSIALHFFRPVRPKKLRDIQEAQAKNRSVEWSAFD